MSQCEPRPRELLARFEFDEKKLKLIGNAGRQWISRDLGKGAVLAGMVSEVRPGADASEVEVTLLGKAAAPVNVVMRSDSASNLRVGQRLLVSGTIVPEPSINLTGYEGIEERVIWAGLVYPLP